MLVIDNAWFPVLVMVIYCDAVADPTASLPNTTLVGDNVTAGPSPVPVSAMLCGEPPALSVMLTAAANEPPVVGSKYPVMVHVPPAATLVPHVFVNANDDAFAPVTPIPVIVKVDCPVLVSVTDCDAVAVPTFDDPNARLVADSVTAGPSPVPLSAIACGEPPALSTIVMAAVRAPPVSGLKWPWMLQFAPAAKLVPQEFANVKDEAFAPVMVMLAIDSAWLPLLVIVMYCDAVTDPTATLPNATLVVDSVTAGPSPVPVSAMLCGDPEALSVIEMAAVSDPPAVGSKSPVIVQVPPAATLVPHVFVNANEVAFAPVTPMLVIDNATPPVLVSVTDCVAVAVPTGDEPNERLVADRVTAGPTPVPLNAIVCGEFPALSMIVIAAVRAPTVVGAKWPWSVQLAPAASVAEQLFPNGNEDAFAPVTVILAMFNVALPVLVSTKYSVAVELPTGSDPNE